MTFNQIVLPFDLGLVLPDDAPVRTLYDVTNRLDYSKLNSIYRNNAVHKKYEPKLLFQIILLGYINEMISCRKIEKACRYDISFMWLLQGQSAPDHNTINRFRNEIGDVFDDLFSQFIMYLSDIGEVNANYTFIDGTKIQSFANQYTWVWYKSVLRNDENMQVKIKAFIQEINSRYQTNYSYSKKHQAKFLKDILTDMNNIKVQENIEFVHGSGKRKTQLQKDYETIEVYLQKRLTNDMHYKILDGRNSYSKTDHEATFMRMKEDHMMNGQLKPAYNVQVAASGGYCVGVNVYNDRADVVTLIPFLDYLENIVGIKHRHVVADAGYESEENYLHLRKKNQITMIKPSNYERSKKRNYANDIRQVENMKYNKEEDYYICGNGKKMKYIKTVRRTSKTGFVSDKKVYECESCASCEIKNKCTKSKGNRQLYISKVFMELRSESRQNIISELGKQLRVNRSIQAEGLFGVLKGDHNFRRFLTKNMKNVHTEIRFLMLAINMIKLHNKIMTHNLGYTLHTTRTG